MALSLQASTQVSPVAQVARRHCYQICNSMTAEIYECRKCLASAPLNIHGRCSFCDSDDVESQEVIAARSRVAFEYERRRFPMVMMEVGAA